jgi:O-methyltransferase involved in polyketide biosynthesis
LIGSRLPLREAIKTSPDDALQVFAVDEEQPSDSPATFVPTQFASEALATALEKSDFNKLKASLFVWLGGAGYRTVDAAMASLAFIASLPRGSGVVFDYAVDRASLGSLKHTALDALASRVLVAGGNVKYLIQPQAVAAMLRGFGFHRILDLAQEDSPVAQRARTRAARQERNSSALWAGRLIPVPFSASSSADGRRLVSAVV